MIKLALRLVLLMSSTAAHAQVYEVVTPNCPVYRVENGAWVKTAGIPLAAGSKVNTRPIPGRANQVYLMVGQETILAPTTCLKPAAAAPIVARAEKKSIPQRSNSRSEAATTYPFFLWASLISWNESLMVTASTGATGVETATQVGGLFGIGTQLKLSSSLQLELPLGGLFAMSTVAAPSTSMIQYAVSGASVMGAWFEPKFLWFPGGDSFHLGLGFPLYYRMANWPASVVGTTTVSFANSVLNQLGYGTMFYLRYKFSSWTLGAGAGEIGQLNSLGMSFTIQKRI